ncbi:Chemotaxis response - phosphatase CheZ [hydrothermal vent metagenome]|uniref:Protein phosphatase CheZ n=1 Tax=hydrothermal vent metagenome TaxID=652676 RepID=A0A3B1A144_9ZZZZ
MEQQQNLLSPENIAKVKNLLASMEAGDLEKSQNYFDELAEMRESELYQEIGKLTRELHDSINTFGLDDRLTDIAEDEIPDARQRLAHVITMTDEAANSTLTAVEDSMPLCEQVLSATRSVENEWQRFSNRELNVDEFKRLSKELKSYFEINSSSAAKINEHLNKVLMAQGFQDLTSQIIKRVISLVEEVETSMVSIIQLAGSRPNSNKTTEEDNSGKLEGPVIPGLEASGTVSGQDEVDDLLSSLGF